MSAPARPPRRSPRRESQRPRRSLLRRNPLRRNPARRNPWLRLRWMGATALFAGILLIAGVVPWTAGLVQFARAIPDRVADPDSRTDAIVVLTGGSDRVATGLRLLAENKAVRVFISGVGPGAQVERVVKLAGAPAEPAQDRLSQQLEGWPDERIEAGHGARDTAGNAQETAAWMREHGYHSLRLVTGAYHMPRSLLEFRALLPEARVVPHPVFPDHVKQKAWWFRPGTAALIIGEYNKYLLASLEHWAFGGRIRQLGATWAQEPRGAQRGLGRNGQARTGGQG